MGKFRLAETSGKEDLYIKQVVFTNNGSASDDDLELFKLKRDNQVISSASKMIDGDIVFDVSYLRLSAGKSLDLSVSANLDVDHQSGRSVDLELKSVKAVGTSYNLSLTPAIGANLNEIFLLP
jgi:hypothetical protein